MPNDANPAHIPPMPFLIAPDPQSHILPDWASLILDGIDEALFSVDRDWRFTHVNRQASAMWGQSPAALLGQVLWEMSPSPLGGPFEPFYRQAMLTGVPGRLEDFSLVKQAWYDVGVYPVPPGLIVSFQDITARKQAEAEVQIREERFRALIEHSPDAIALFHVDGTIAYGSPATTPILGYPLDEFVGRNGFDLIHPEDRPRVAEQLATILRDPTISVPVYVRIRHYDGSWRMLEGMFTNLLDNPSVGAIINNYRDVTERVRTETALQLSEERFKTLSEAAYEGLVIHENGMIVEANQRTAELSGYTRDELIGLSIDHLVAPEILPTIHEHLATDPEYMGEAIAVRKDGTRYIVESRGKLIDYQGRRMRLVAVRDLTDLKQAEAALRTTQAQLLQSQKMESVGQLAGGIAHDFNNLLSVIIGYCDLIVSGLVDTDPLYADLLEIQKAGNRAAALVRQILAFSRQQILKPHVVNLNATVTDMDALLHRVLGTDIDVLTLLDPQLATVLVDPGQIEQVIVNLAVNARDAMPEGGHLTIETANVDLHEHYRSIHHPEVKTGAYVMISVSDTGTGMDLATQGKIFEPFFTTKGPGKGTGLGLATVYGIVRQSGGYVWVYSEVGIGTTFKIYLPIVADAALDASVPVPDHRTVPLASIDRAGDGRTILVVEDDAAVRDLVLRVLAEAGYTVMEAHNGHMALDVVATAASEIYLVLTDMVMPEMGGRVLVDQLKEQWPELPVLCMSGYTDHTVQRHRSLRPCDAFLQKPFTPEALLRRIGDMIHHAGADECEIPL